LHTFDRQYSNFNSLAVLKSSVTIHQKFDVQQDTEK